MRRGQAVHDPEHELTEDHNGEEPQSLEQRICGGMPLSRMSDNPNAAKQATDAMATAVHTRRSGILRKERADEHHDRGRCLESHVVATRRGHSILVTPTILQPHGVPQQRQDREESRVDQGEAPAAVTRGVGSEHRQEHQHAHLHEDEAARPAVLATVELDVERSIHPSRPDEREDDGELCGRAGGHVLGRKGAPPERSR